MSSALMPSPSYSYIVPSGFSLHNHPISSLVNQHYLTTTSLNTEINYLILFQHYFMFDLYKLEKNFCTGTNCVLNVAFLLYYDLKAVSQYDLISRLPRILRLAVM